MERALAEMAEHERPRERLFEHGADALRDAELLALVLRSGHEGEGALVMAERLLAEFGGLSGLGGARADELARRRGMGPAKAASVVAACQLAGRIRAHGERIPVLRSAVDVADVAIPLLEHCRTERVLALVVDATGRMRRTITLTEQSAAPSPVLVREVLGAVLHQGGAGLALVSNHPHGDPAPSEVDRFTADAVAAGASSVGLRFVAHVTVAGHLWDEVPVRSRPIPSG